MIPLATRMRPTKLQEFVGQTHFMFEGSLFYNSIKKQDFRLGDILRAVGYGQNDAGPAHSRRIGQQFRGNKRLYYRHEGT